MCNADLIKISHETSELLKEFDSEYLADVLRVWDCDSQEWYDETTTVLRFENDDLLIWSEDGVMRARRGAVPNGLLDQETYVLIHSDSENHCLCWLPDSSYPAQLGCSHQCKVILGMLS